MLRCFIRWVCRCFRLRRNMGRAWTIFWMRRSRRWKWSSPKKSEKRGRRRGGHHRAAQRGQVDAVEPDGGRGALDRFADSWNDDGQCGYGSDARGAHVPVRGHRGDSAQRQDDPGGRKIERGDGAAGTGALRRRAAGGGRRAGSDSGRRANRELRGGVRAIGDHCHQQVGFGRCGGAQCRFARRGQRERKI